MSKLAITLAAGILGAIIAHTPAKAAPVAPSLAASIDLQKATAAEPVSRRYRRHHRPRSGFYFHFHAGPRYHYPYYYRPRPYYYGFAPHYSRPHYHRRVWTCRRHKNRRVCGWRWR